MKENIEVTSISENLEPDKKRRHHKITVVIAVLMVAVLLFVGVTQVFADNQGVYISDVRVAYGETADEAKQQLIDEGYEVFETNLLVNSKIKGKKYEYIGYKTTSDKDDAITDIRLMNMNCGYETMDYRAFMASFQKNLDVLGERFQSAVSETKANVKAGRPLALAAKEMLDMFVYDDMSLSEYLFDESRTSEDFQDLILICNSAVITSVYGILNMGVTDDNSDTFATRFANADAFNYSSDGEYETADKKYQKIATDLSESLLTFCDNYQKAVEIYGIDGSDEDEFNNLDVKVEGEYDKSLRKTENVMEYIFEQGYDEVSSSDQNYLLYLGVYNILQKYDAPDLKSTEKFGKPTNLAEYIVAYGKGVADSSNLQDDEVRYLYPLMASLTSGQLGSISVNGWMNTFLYLNNNTAEIKTKVLENYEKYAVSRLEKSDSKYVNNDGKIDIFAGTRRDLFDTEIALTSEASRKSAAANEFARLTETGDDLESDLTYAMWVAAFAGAIAAGTACVVFAAINIAVGGGFGIASAITGLVLGCTWMTGTCATGLLVGCILGVAFTAIAVLAAVAVIAVLVWRLIHKKKEAEKKQKELENSVKPIPTVTVDTTLNGEEYVYTLYYAVTDLEGNTVDITELKYSWDALYYSKDESAGTPLKITDNVLLTSSEQGATPDNMRPLAYFDQKYSANFAEAQSSKNNLFLYFYSEGSVDGTEGGSAEQNETYLRTLRVYSNKDADVAKSEILKSDLELFDVDLTPGSGVHTYLAYGTTHLESEAIRDIRVAYGSTLAETKKATFGNVPYACAGALGGGYYLYISTLNTYASPVYADLFVCNDHSDAPEGYEPVNLFSGGDACDFYNSKNVVSTGEKHRYLYFHPKETFTGEKQYVSGISFVNSTLSDETKLNDFVSGLGYSFTDAAGTTDICSNATESGKTYIVISYTANPYRAISDITAYTASQSAYACGDFLGMGSRNYAVCETYIQSGSTYKLGYTNAYIPRATDDNGQTYRADGFSLSSQYQDGKRIINEEGTADWIAPHALYVCGTTSNGQDVLTKDDILFSTSAKSVDGYRPVTDITEQYSDTAENLTFEYIDSTIYSIYMSASVRAVANETTFKTHLYIHIKGDKLERGKYVSGIYVSSNTTKSYSDDNAIFSAVSSHGTGELIHYNIAKKSDSQSYVENDDGTVTETEISGNTSYIYVTYSNVKSDALRDVVIYRVDSKDTAVEDTIDINGATYNKCGDVVNSPNGYYYLYSCTNYGTGFPITDVLLDSDWFTAEYKTVIDYDGQINTKDPYRIKLKYDTQISEGESGEYVNKIKVAFGSSRDDCAKQLLAAGCTHLVDRNKNSGIDGSEYVYFGYNATRDRTDENIITGIDFLVSDTAVSSPAPYKENGVTYTCAETRNLNNVSGGKYIYLYTTTDSSLHPLSKIGYLNLLDYDGNVERNGQYWFQTENLTAGTKYTNSIYYKNTENWSYKDGVLTLDYIGDMPDYDPAKKFSYLKTLRLRKTGTVSYLPEWSDKGKNVKSVIISERVTKLDDYAFYGLTAINKVTIKSKTLEIPDGLIPEGTTMVCYYGSKAHEYYKAHAEEDNLKLQFFSETISAYVNGAAYFKLENNVLTFGGNGSVKEALPVLTGSGSTDNVKITWYYLLESALNSDEIAKALISQVTDIVIEKGITEVPAGYFDYDGLEFSSLKTITVENPDCILSEGSFPGTKGINYKGYFNSSVYDYRNSIAQTDTSSTFTPTAEQSGKITTKSSWMYSNGVLAFIGTGTAKKFDFKGKVDIGEITTIYIEKGIKSFSPNAFDGYTSLKEVIFVDSVNTMKSSVKTGLTSLPTGMFAGCTALETIVMPAGVTRIEERAFYGCSSLEKVSLNESVAYIGKESFCTNSSGFALTVMNPECEFYAEDETFILSSGTLYGIIDSTAEAYFNSVAEKNPPFEFEYFISSSGNLTETITYSVSGSILSVEGDGSLTDLQGQEAPFVTDLKEKYALEEFTKLIISEGVDAVPSDYFASLTGLQSVTVNNPFCEISENAFPENESLVYNGSAYSTLKKYAESAGASYYYPTDGEGTFTSGATWLVSNGELVLMGTGDADETVWDAADNANITAVVIESGISGMPSGLLSDMPSLRRVLFIDTLADGNISTESALTAIPESFCCADTSLEQIEIPESVTEVGANAFSRCISLTEITFNGESVELVEEGAFPENEDLKVYCHENSVTWQTVEQAGITPISIRSKLTGSVFGTSVNGTLLICVAVALVLFTVCCITVKKFKKSKKKKEI